MSRTKRQQPRNGQFKNLKASKEKRNKKQRQLKASLSKYVSLESRHHNIELENERKINLYMDAYD